MYDIPSNYCIIDSRVRQEYKYVTFSNYKKQDVLKAYKNALIKSNCEESIRWAVELNISGYNKQIIDILEEVYLKFININNIYLYIYLKKQIKRYNKIIDKYPKNEELHLRNIQEFRNLICELTTLCAITKKNNFFMNEALPKISNVKLYEKSELKKHTTSKELNKIYKYISENDSKELKVALNEIIHNIEYKNGSYKECIYWYIWLEKINNYLKRNNQVIKCKETKLNVPAESKRLYIWKIWEILNNTMVTEMVSKYINKLYNYYITNFKKATINKKKYIIFMCFYICKNENFITKLCAEEHILIQSVGNINKMYQVVNKKTILKEDINYNSLNLLNNIEEVEEEIVDEKNKEVDEKYENIVNDEEEIYEEIEEQKDITEVKMDYFKYIVPKK